MKIIDLGTPFNKVKVKLTDKIGFRPSKPGDLNYLGNQIPKDVIVFVREKDCKVIEEKDGCKFLSPTNAKAMPQVPLSQFSPDIKSPYVAKEALAFGKWKKKCRKNSVKAYDLSDKFLRELFTQDFYEAEVYYAERDKAFIGKIRRFPMKSDEKVEKPKRKFRIKGPSQIVTPDGKVTSLFDFTVDSKIIR